MAKRELLRAILLILLGVLSPWFYWFWQKGSWPVVVYFILSPFLLWLSLPRKGKWRYLWFPLLVFPILLNPLSVQTIFKLNDLEIYTINQRRTYYPNGLAGKFFENKVNRYVFNYQRNFFQALDPNYYFFGNHPRERAGVKEIRKFSFLGLPFFIYGLFLQIKRREYFTLGFFLICLTFISFFEPIDAFSFLLFPFFVVMIGVGLLEFISKLKRE